MNVWILAWMESYEAGVSLEAFASEAEARAGVDAVNAKNGKKDPFIESETSKADSGRLAWWKNKGLYFVELYCLPVKGIQLIELTKLDRSAVYIAERDKLTPAECERLCRAEPGEVVLLREPSAVQKVANL